MVFSSRALAMQSLTNLERVKGRARVSCLPQTKAVKDSYLLRMDLDNLLSSLAPYSVSEVNKRR